MSRDAGHFTRIAAGAAVVTFVVAAGVFGAMPEHTAGFSHRTHPLAWLGADAVPGGRLFNVFGFVLPGLLAAVALWPLRPALPPRARWSARIGAQLVLLSALAFAAQGLLPLEFEDLDGFASSLHGTVWTGWCLAFGAGALGLAWGLRGTGWRRGGVAVCAFAGAGVLLLAFAAPLWLPAALAQRAAFLLWFGWVGWAGWSAAARYGGGA